MGSTGDLFPASSAHDDDDGHGAPDEMTVLVTGFAPFQEQFPRNPSWEIAKSLPAYLPPLPAKGPRPAAEDLPALIPPVRILVHPEAVHVGYETVRTLVPTLWDGPGGHGGDGNGSPDRPRPRIDAMLHVGMAHPRLHYCIERRGHRDGYKMKDVDGALLGDEERHAREGAGWIWHGLPAELETDLDVDDVLRRWRRYSPDTADLRISDDAGHYLCDFLYYSSLAHLYRRDEHRRVVFLHVPASSSDESLRRGTALALQLIRAICESERARSRDGEAAAAAAAAAGELR